jgi:hypothetical protein
MHNIGPDYSKRDCLLPSGCKDLMDVLNLEKKKALESEQSAQGFILKSLESKPTLPRRKSPLEGKTVELRPTTVVKALAQLIGIKPFMIIADLMELGLFATVNQPVSFDAAAKVLAKYGVAARKVA